MMPEVQNSSLIVIQPARACIPVRTKAEEFSHSFHRQCGQKICTFELPNSRQVRTLTSRLAAIEGVAGYSPRFSLNGD